MDLAFRPETASGVGMAVAVAGAAVYDVPSWCATIRRNGGASGTLRGALDDAGGGPGQVPVGGGGAEERRPRGGPAGDRGRRGDAHEGPEGPAPDQPPGDDPPRNRAPPSPAEGGHHGTPPSRGRRP